MKKMIPVEMMGGRTNGMMISLMIFRFFTFSILAASIRALGIPPHGLAQEKDSQHIGQLGAEAPYLVAEADFWKSSDSWESW